MQTTEQKLTALTVRYKTATFFLTVFILSWMLAGGGYAYIANGFTGVTIYVGLFALAMAFHFRAKRLDIEKRILMFESLENAFDAMLKDLRIEIDRQREKMRETKASSGETGEAKPNREDASMN